MIKHLSHFLAAAFLVFFLACTKNSIDPEKAVVTINFNHQNNETPLVLDELIYTNAVGQDYSIKTVKYFISKVTFHKSNGLNYTSPDIHFVDIRETESLKLELSNKIPYGSYKGISFVFGLVTEDNITGSLGLELDRVMEWPLSMGGGYHYMKLEGDYIGSNGNAFFNFHAGPLEGKPYEIHIDLPNSSFTVEDNLLNINMEMAISNWFTNPIDWDFEYWGAGIMGNPDAQATVQKNGADVFSITFPLETN